MRRKRSGCHGRCIYGRLLPHDHKLKRKGCKEHKEHDQSDHGISRIKLFSERRKKKKSERPGRDEDTERLAAAGLELVTKMPEAPIRIMADGRRMWRIFDNLMNNIRKYALPGTRVYLSLERMMDSAVISFKNTSSAPLNISEEELLERFVRGDSARTGDGNGLGLSIARSLAELQGGQLRLYIDGDLFKAILVFPVAE